jgi:hypothetical protein
MMFLNYITCFGIEKSFVLLQDFPAAVLPGWQTSPGQGDQARVPVGPRHPAARHPGPEGDVWGSPCQVCAQEADGSS